MEIEHAQPEIIIKIEDNLCRQVVSQLNLGEIIS